MQPNEDAALESLSISLLTEAKVNRIMQSLLQIVIRHYAVDTIPNDQINFKAIELIRDFTRMTPDE